ncbi:MAG: chemotaxis protein CheB [Spirochaetaceae bacterium]
MTDEKTTEESAKTAESGDTETAGEPFRVVGIGASAGGLEALEEFFRAVPGDTNLAFVVVQHLSPDYKSLMVELLSKYTRMKVVRAEDGMPVRANHVYLITPRKNLNIFHGKLYLTEQKHGQSLNLPIDIFLRSLAEDSKEKAIGIILSGTGSDGTLGIRAVKGAGGLVFAQDNLSAKFDGMPNSASSTGMVDYVLPPQKIAEELARIIQHPLIHREGGEESEKGMEEANDLSKILSILRDRVGHDFSAYKDSTVVRRIERRISINRLGSMKEYASLVDTSLHEVNVLYKDLLIGVTRFFRDREAFQKLEDTVIPALLKDRDKDRKLRIWSMGCSTGEEPYSLAILFYKKMKELNREYDIKIFATDTDRESIEYAGVGVYPESIVADIDQDLLQRYFTKKQNTFQVKPEIRKMVIFAHHNIMRDPPFSSIDMVSCRNMLIYLKPKFQQKVLGALHFSLRKGGYLLLGTSETVGDLGGVFTPVDSRLKIFRCQRKNPSDKLSDYFVPPVHIETKKKREPEKKPYIRNTSSLRNNDDMLESAYSYLLQEYVPPSVVVDSSLNLVHICRESGDLIRMPAGKVSLNVLTLVPDGLKAAVSTAVHRSIKENSPITYGGLYYKNGDETGDETGDTSYRINLSVRPVLDGENKAAGYFLIVFDSSGVERSRTPEQTGHELQESVRADRQHEIVTDLEQELQFTKENLQATIEELETSNEELQATNEELIASNEELQSTNEELQSVNEELYTVNAEYQNKIEELTMVNNDIKNFLNNTDIGMVFLDKNLTIRKYTPAVSSAINIMEMDIGRPLEHLTRNIRYPNFIKKVKEVLETLVPVEEEIVTKENRYMMMKINPYRTINNVIEGIVLVFVDIDERIQSEQQLERERNLLMTILENSPIGKTMVDREGRIIFVNTKAAEIFGLPREEVLSRSFSDRGWQITDYEGSPIDPSELPFSIIMRDSLPVNDYRHAIKKDDGTLVKLKINGAPVLNDKKKAGGAVFSIEEA